MSAPAVGTRVRTFTGKTGTVVRALADLRAGVVHVRLDPFRVAFPNTKPIVITGLFVIYDEEDVVLEAGD